jgi:hypothetical protein
MVPTNAPGPVSVMFQVMFPAAPPGIPMQVPVVALLESAAVPTHVPVTAADVPVAIPAGVVAAGAAAVGLLGVEVLPPHAAKPTERTTTIKPGEIRIGGSVFKQDRQCRRRYTAIVPRMLDAGRGMHRVRRYHVKTRAPSASARVGNASGIRATNGALPASRADLLRSA